MYRPLLSKVEGRLLSQLIDLGEIAQEVELVSAHTEQTFNLFYERVLASKDKQAVRIGQVQLRASASGPELLYTLAPATTAG